MSVQIRRSDKVKTMRFEELEELFCQGQIGPNTWVRVEILTGPEFKRLGTLPIHETLLASQKFSIFHHIRLFKSPVVSFVLLGVLLRFYFLGWIPQLDFFLQDLLMNESSKVFEVGEVYRLISHAFLHHDLNHLLFNLCFLFYASVHLERHFGWRNVLCFFVTGVFFGGVTSACFSPDEPSIGVSSGVYALMVVAVLAGRSSDLPPQESRYFGWAFLPYLIFGAISSLFSDHVDHWGHVGGLFAGLFLSFWLHPRWHSSVSRNPLRRRFLFVFVLCVYFSIFLSGSKLIRLEIEQDEFGWQLQYPSRWRSGWTAWGDRGWFSPTRMASMSAATILHSQPVNRPDFSSIFMGQGMSEAKQIFKQHLMIHGVEALLMEHSVNYAGRAHVLKSLVFMRGHYEHRIMMLIRTENLGAYEKLWKRLQAAVSLFPPRALQSAEQSHLGNPNSLSASIELAEQFRLIGRTEEAVSEFNRTLRGAKNSIRAAEGLFRIHSLHPNRYFNISEVPISPELLPKLSAHFTEHGEERLSDEVERVLRELNPNLAPLKLKPFP